MISVLLCEKKVTRRCGKGGEGRGINGGGGIQTRNQLTGTVQPRGGSTGEGGGGRWERSLALGSITSLGRGAKASHLTLARDGRIHGNDTKQGEKREKTNSGGEAGRQEEEREKEGNSVRGREEREAVTARPCWGHKRY
ncbi:hypothetical protein Pcinc_037836 [Petrolisthes cinctipes]|uniref:Uncharacterized protein n=1 Tax=Petrolisthes cinctipes TaxID=88211 RepID=A0AAE1BUZ2_PETCI|nr:hypothetical protein Pcinc_037836 [Petrolisthes cinctipes]